MKNKGENKMDFKVLDKILNHKHYAKIKIAIFLLAICGLMIGLGLSGLYEEEGTLILQIFGAFGVVGVLMILISVIQINKRKDYAKIFKIEEDELGKIHDNLVGPLYENKGIILGRNYVFILNNRAKKMILDYDEIGKIEYGKEVVYVQGLLGTMLTYIFTPRSINFTDINGKNFGGAIVKKKEIKAVEDTLKTINDCFVITYK